MRITVAATVLVLTVAALAAQRPAFAVASIRISPNGVRADESFSRIRPGEVRFSHIELRHGLLPLAFNLSFPLVPTRFDLSRAANNVLNRSADIHAKGPVDGDNAAMALALLEERFGLKWHTETRQVPVYVLTVKQPGKLGPWLKPSTVNCQELARAERELPDECRSVGTLRNGAMRSRGAGACSDKIACCLATETSHCEGNPPPGCGINP